MARNGGFPGTPFCGTRELRIVGGPSDWRQRRASCSLLAGPEEAGKTTQTGHSWESRVRSEGPLTYDVLSEL